MCDEVDQQKKSSSDSEYTTDEEWEQEQRLVRADWEKERVICLFLIFIKMTLFRIKGFLFSKREINFSKTI